MLCFLELSLACSVSNYCYYFGGARSKGLAQSGMLLIFAQLDRGEEIVVEK